MEAQAGSQLSALSGPNPSAVPWVKKRSCGAFRVVARAATKTRRKSDDDSEPSPKREDPLAKSRRDLILGSVNLAILGDVIGGTDDTKTIVNSILGAYGLPQLKSNMQFKTYDNFDEGYAFEYPRSWVGRQNRLRQGLYLSDFNTGDKAVLEVFPQPMEGGLVAEVVRRAVTPGAEVGGDARLLMPPARRIHSEQVELDGQVYMYVAFPSETITRSGYQVQRKNFGVAALQPRSGNVYALVASARSDQFDKAKDAVLRRIIASFRLRA